MISTARGSGDFEGRAIYFRERPVRDAGRPQFSVAAVRIEKHWIQNVSVLSAFGMVFCRGGPHPGPVIQNGSVL